MSLFAFHLPNASKLTAKYTNIVVVPKKCKIMEGSSGIIMRCANCSKKQEDTKTEDVKVIMTTSCRQCHRSALRHVVHMYYKKSDKSDCGHCSGDKENIVPKARKRKPKSTVNKEFYKKTRFL